MSRGTVRQEGRRKGEPAVKGVPWYFVVDIAPPGGKRQQVRRRGFRTQAEAQEALEELVTSVRASAYVPPSAVTFGDYMIRWLDGLAAKGRRPTTVAGYREKVANHVLGSPLATLPLQGVTTADLNRHYSHLSTAGRKRGDGGLSARTVRYVHSVVSKALSDAEREGLVTKNPARLASPPSTSAAKAPEMAVWTPVELRTFLRFTAAHHHGRLLHLAAMTGLRRGELCGLRWADIDLDAGRLTVRQTVTAPAGRISVGPAKTARSRRSVDLDPGMVAVLRDQRTAQLEERLLVGPGYHDDGYAFAMPDGRPWHPDVISRAFDRLVTSSGLPRIHLHSLRHGHAAHLLAAGANVKVVSERLGHSSVSFTLDTYGHVLPGQQAEAASAVATLISAAL